VSHAIAALVITLYPGGLIGIREARRRKEIKLDAGQLYLAAVAQEAADSRKRR
jgi:ArsR family metal-binding transcriptional regulator